MTDLQLRYCEQCARWFVDARRFCSEHPDTMLDVRELSGQGVVYSYTVSHTAMSPELADAVPYTVVLVETDEGPRVLAHFDAGDHPRIGERVALVVRDERPGRPGGRVARRTAGGVE